MGESGGAALKGRGWPQDGWGVAIGRFQGYGEKSLGWVAVKPHWVGFVEEAGLDVGPDERGLPPGRAEQGACVPHGAVLPVSRGVRTAIPEPGREKSKAGRGSRKKAKGGGISGNFGYPVGGGKEKEERTIRKADGNIRATSRGT